MRAVARLAERALRSPAARSSLLAPSAARPSRWHSLAPLSPLFSLANVGFGVGFAPRGARWAATLSDEHKIAATTRAVVKGGSSPVLKFDETGEGVVLELSRSQLLHKAQDAAIPVEAEEEAEPKASSGDQAFRRQRGDPLGGSACDIQLVHARDIRKLDNTFSVFNEPSIEIRNQAILVSADPIRAVLMRDACLVFVHDQTDSVLTTLQHNFREMVHLDAAVPFEFRALEAMLATLSFHFKDVYERTAPDVAATLDRLAHGQVNVSDLERLREFKNTMNGFESQVDHVSRALLKLLDNEEDLRLLYLTKLHNNPSLLGNLWSYDSEEAEVLIESYLQDIVSTRTKTALLQRQIVNTESLVMLKLDSMRNYLLGVDLIFSLAVISLAVGTFVTGVFGMNLPSGFEDTQGLFWSVASATALSVFSSTTLGVLYFKKKGILWKI